MAEIAVAPELLAQALFPDQNETTARIIGARFDPMCNWIVLDIEGSAVPDSPMVQCIVTQERLTTKFVPISKLP